MSLGRIVSYVSLHCKATLRKVEPMVRRIYHPVRDYHRVRFGELELVRKHKRRSRDDDKWHLPHKV